MATSTDTPILSAPAPGRVEISGRLYKGIPCRIACAGSEAIVRAGWDLLLRIDDVFNVYRSDSELGTINAAGPGRHACSAWLRACLALAAEAQEVSDGAWSATMLPLVRLWRASAGGEPDPEALAEAVAAADPASWSLHREAVTVHRPLAFDLGGLAKGFAVDRVVEHLREAGVSDYLVQVGGETACAGIAPSGGLHRIGIPHPDDPDNAYSAIIQDPGSGLCGSTSGSYRQGLVTGAGTAHHIIDPRSGRPLPASAASLTLVFRGPGRNAWADALTTALTVQGPQALAQVCARSGAAGFSLRRDATGELLASATAGWAALCTDDG